MVDENARLHSLLLTSRPVVQAQKVVPSIHLVHFLIGNFNSQSVHPLLSFFNQPSSVLDVALMMDYFHLSV